MKIFILEDDPLRNGKFVQSTVGLDVTMASSYIKAINRYEPPYDVVCLDHDLGGKWMVGVAETNTGSNFAKWMPAKSNHDTRIVVHSYNETGARNMMNTLRLKGYTMMTYCPFGTALLTWLEGLPRT